MVAELTDIPVASVERKTPTVDPAKLRSSARRRNRPRWIQTATREPIYSVLDSNERVASNDLPIGVKRKVVVISAVKSDKSRGNDSRIEQGASRRNKVTPEELEDEDPLYSVVRKPKKVQLPETGFFERKLQPIKEGSSEEKTCSRQEELRKWLQIASKQLPEPRRLFTLGEMYTNHPGEYDQLQGDWKRSVSMPRGIVGLVGPYRVYQNPNERREYMLQEEELVEEVVDSVSEIAARENNATEHRQRAKWRIREEDEETLVPDIRDIPGLEEFTGEVDHNKETSEWKQLDDQSTIEYSKTEDEISKSKGDESKGSFSEIVTGKEERAIDVPDEISTVSTSSVKEKKGERSFLFNNFIEIRLLDTRHGFVY